MVAGTPDLVGLGTRDPLLSNDERTERHATHGSDGEPEPEDIFMLFLDPPDHTRPRGLVNKAFTPRAVERLRA
jgi:cytochrome P450